MADEVISKLDIKRALGLTIGQGGPVRLEMAGKTAEDLDRAIASIDQGAILQEERGALTWEVWDEQTPVNGRAPDFVLQRLRERGDWPEGGRIYLIKEGDRAIYLQPFAPGEGFNPMTEDDCRAHAEAHAESLIRERAAGRVVAAVQEALEGA